MRYTTGAVAVLLVGLAACSAQDRDAQFSEQLVERDVFSAQVVEENRASMVEEAKAWCERLEGMDSRGDVEAFMAERLAGESAGAQRQAAVFLGTATEVYCPEYAEEFASAS